MEPKVINVIDNHFWFLVNFSFGYHINIMVYGVNSWTLKGTPQFFHVQTWGFSGAKKALPVRIASFLAFTCKEGQNKGRGEQASERRRREPLGWSGVYSLRKSRDLKCYFQHFPRDGSYKNKYRSSVKWQAFLELSPFFRSIVKPDTRISALLNIYR